ncbi:uncharacterized protein B0H18DRAFT_1045008 [Fomitopsis serialis]|uniref:uncharacterized protein n=1 Tax=Fomitopsis serialis TaxID=139415 RepID=UPI002007E04A|nr:uncharacterized protein B0H18DRAFT_1045008 [Neoantrodia serialis]KAH9914546.1 hypothetical protein B0H18DRAFT_1045008 [Neoantrodia serialis]
MARTKATAKKAVGLLTSARHNDLDDGHAVPAEISDVNMDDAPPAPQSIEADDGGEAWHEIYCYMCHNGGDMLICDWCLRAMCSECLNKIDITKVPQKWDFKCPTCYYKDWKDKDKYYAFQLNGERVMDEPTIISGGLVGPQHAHVNTRHLAIVVFRLKSLERKGSIPELLKAHLESWFWQTNTLHYYDIPFDLQDLQDADRHAQRVRAVIDKLIDVECRRVVTFVYTHSNILRGDLYHAWDATSSIDKFFFRVLTPPYLEYTKQYGETSHWMFILACGAIITSPKALDTLDNELLKHRVPFCIGFTASSLNAHLAADFIIAFGSRVLIERARLTSKTLRKLLQLSWSLRRHGSIVLFRLCDNEAGMRWIAREEYVWHHRKLAPAGHPTPLQCPECKHLHTLKTFYTDAHAGYVCMMKDCSFEAEWEVDYDAEAELDAYDGGWRMRPLSVAHLL